MDYRMAKQFYTKSVDNFFNFFYKIGDFFKLQMDVFWAFIDIWAQFFAIFGNLFLYVHYLNIFILDRILTRFAFLSVRHKMTNAHSYKPQTVYEHAPTPIVQTTKGLTKKAVKSVGNATAKSVEKVADVTTTVVKTPKAEKKIKQKKQRKKSGGKLKFSEFFKKFFNVIIDFFAFIEKIIFQPFAWLIKLIFHKRKKKVAPDDRQSSAGSSLIDQYMHEYEHKKH